MTKKSLGIVFLLMVVTFGIYFLVWYYKAKNEMVAQGAEIPTFLLLFIPFVNIWWIWKFAGGVERVTGGKMKGLIAFVLLLFLSWIGVLVIQNEFNHLGAT